jgi:hypothetical protein
VLLRTRRRLGRSFWVRRFRMRRLGMVIRLRRRCPICFRLLGLRCRRMTRLSRGRRGWMRSRRRSICWTTRWLLSRSRRGGLCWSRSRWRLSVPRRRCRRITRRRLRRFSRRRHFHCRPRCRSWTQARQLCPRQRLTGMRCHRRLLLLERHRRRRRSFFRYHLPVPYCRGRSSYMACARSLRSQHTCARRIDCNVCAYRRCGDLLRSHFDRRRCDRLCPGKCTLRHCRHGARSGAV